MSVRHHYLKLLAQYCKDGFVIMTIKVIGIEN